MLSMKDVSFSYSAGETVLDGLNLNLVQDEIVCLLGPSGCGKSTVLRLISGLETPDGGEIARDFEAQSIGFVFQQPALMPWADAAGNVALPLVLKGGCDEEKLLAALSLVGMEGLAGRHPAELSGGQQMRVSIARALVSDPSVLLMDEPFAALDEILRFQMNELVLALRAKSGCGVLFVTHSLYEAAYIADRVLVMAGGKAVGEVCPELDRSLTPERQRAAPAFSEAVKAISRLLAKGQDSE